MSEKEKILKVLELQGVSVSKAEQILGLGVGTISKMLARNGSLHDDNLKKFQRIFRVREEWWKSGKGEVFLEPEAKPVEVNEPTVEYGLVDKMIKTYETALASKNEEILRLVEDKKWLREHVQELTTKISSPQQA